MKYLVDTIVEGKLTQVEQDITFPAYYAFAAAYFKITSPDTYILADINAGSWQIRKEKDLSKTVTHVIAGGKTITAVEFSNGFDRVLAHATHEAFLQRSKVKVNKAELRAPVTDLLNEVKEYLNTALVSANKTSLLVRIEEELLSRKLTY